MFRPESEWSYSTGCAVVGTEFQTGGEWVKGVGGF